MLLKTSIDLQSQIFFGKGNCKKILPHTLVNHILKPGYGKRLTCGCCKTGCDQTYPISFIKTAWTSLLSIPRYPMVIDGEE